MTQDPDTDTIETMATDPVRPELNGKVEESIRGLWASLFYSQAPRKKSVVICSADRQEGASSIAAALALAGTSPAGLASVALLDMNLRHPCLHEMLGAKAGPGLAEVITGDLDIAAAAQPINDELDLYAAGEVGANALAMLRSEKTAQVLSTLATRYDHVLIDVVSVNHFPDAQVLAGIVGDVVLVAHSQHTPREALAQAKKRLEAGGGRIVGVVLNLRTYPIPRFLYNRV